MNTKQIIGTGALLALLLTGCGAKPAEESPAQASSSPDANASQGQRQGGERPAMNQGMMQMNLSFQTLIAMDKTEGLAIAKDQAEQLLPIVQESITNNELSADNKAKLTEKLTAEQKKYLEDSEAQMQERLSQGRQGGPNGQGAPGGQDGQGAPRGQGGGRMQGAPGEGPGGQGGQNPQGAPGDGQGQQGAPGGGQGGRGGFGGFGGGMNAGQQLVELLQSK
ncbi:hypothetical protein [Paenibacillus contaminans]|nr:hypothetical protein [Paenibacillus contaminans]